MINWNEFQTTRFKPKLKGNPDYEPKGSCGVYALGYLTGIPLEKIDKRTPRKGWWSDRVMRKFLKEKGYEIYPITHENLYRNKENNYLQFYERNINHQHVLLVSQHTLRQEGTWAVMHNNMYYHSDEIEFFTGLEMISNPFWTGYVVWNKKWKTSQKKLNELLSNTFIGNLIEKDLTFFHQASGRWFRIDKGKLQEIEKI